MIGTPTVLVGIPPVLINSIILKTLIVLRVLPNVVAFGAPTELPTTREVVVTPLAIAVALKPVAKRKKMCQKIHMYNT